VAYDETLAARIPADRPRLRANLVAALVVLLLVAALASNPPREVFGGFEEGISDAELEAAQWAASHHDVIPQNATIAADHRVSSLLWGLAGLHPTWDYTPQTYHAGNVSAVKAELADLRIPSDPHARIDYVLLSPEIEQGVTLTQWENSAPMSPAAIAKFSNATAFQKVYDVQDVRIYRVNWTALSAS
jgi:hypothetical protein